MHRKLAIEHAHFTTDAMKCCYVATITDILSSFQHFMLNLSIKTLNFGLA